MVIKFIIGTGSTQQSEKNPSNETMSYKGDFHEFLFPFSSTSLCRAILSHAPQKLRKRNSYSLLYAFN